MIPIFSSVCQRLYTLYRNLHSFCLLSQTIIHILIRFIFFACLWISSGFATLSFYSGDQAVDVTPSENMYWYTQHSIFSLLYPSLQSSETFLIHSNSIAFVKLKLVSLFFLSSFPHHTVEVWTVYLGNASQMFSTAVETYL